MKIGEWSEAAKFFGVKDYYEILDVEPEDDQITIKERYKEKVKHFHPDVHENKRYAERKIRELNEAFEVLGDQDKKFVYDTLLLLLVKVKISYDIIVSTGKVSEDILSQLKKDFKNTLQLIRTNPVQALAVINNMMNDVDGFLGGLYLAMLAEEERKKSQSQSSYTSPQQKTYNYNPSSYSGGCCIIPFLSFVFGMITILFLVW